MNSLQLIFGLLIVLGGANVLSSVDLLGDFVLGSTRVLANFVGLSINYSQVSGGIINTTLFQQYIAASKVYASSNSQWAISIKNQVPMGYKYNCTAYTAFTTNTTCTFNMMGTGMQRIGVFLKNAGSLMYATSLGFDMQNSDFNNTIFSSTVVTNMDTQLVNYAGMSGGYPPNIQFVDFGDKLVSLGVKSNYTVENYLKDMKQAYWLIGGDIHGPGITEDADPSWLDAFNRYANYYTGKFTVRCVAFKSDDLLTVENVLNESNYRSYIYSRFTTPSGTINPTIGSLSITEMRMSAGLGVAGITNGFVSALWALDMAMQFALFGGTNINFPVDFTTGSMNSVFGPAPTYTPTPMYYAMLMMSIIQYPGSTFILPMVRGGASDKIKVYGLNSGLQLSLLLINKDTNTNASGTVEVKAVSNDYFQCLYLSAPSLTSTTGITLAGYTFNGGSATPVGTYSTLKFYNQNGSYFINLNYSQAALCFISSPGKNFLRVQKSEEFYRLSILLFLLICLSIWAF